MKKIFCLIFVAVLSMSVVGCGEKNKGAEKEIEISRDETSIEVETKPSIAETTDVTTETVVDKLTEASTDGAKEKETEQKTDSNESGTELSGELSTENETEPQTEQPTEPSTENVTEDSKEDETKPSKENTTSRPIDATTESTSKVPSTEVTEKPTKKPTISEITTQATEETTKEAVVAPTEPPTELPTELPTEELYDDGLRDKLVEKAILARDNYIKDLGYGAFGEEWREADVFCDFDLDGIPEFCILRPDVYGRMSGELFIYDGNEYIFKTYLYNYEECEIYKNPEGKTLTLDPYYGQTCYGDNDRDMNNTVYYAKDIGSVEGFFWRIGESYEPFWWDTETQPIYLDADNNKITKEQLEANVVAFFEGYELQKNCGGDCISIKDDDVETSLYDSYDSYLRNRY